MSRLLGVPLAKPEFVDLNNAYKVAQWASRMLDDYPNCVVYTFASSAVRVCMAAKEHHLNLKGTRFLVTGEPLTPQKKAEIEANGAKAIPIYGISEAGVIAAGCNQNHEESDHCHSFKDTIAITSYNRKVPSCDTEVDSSLFTSLLYESPKILLNVEMGDYAVIETKPCTCRFGSLGFDKHISRIRSFEKLTGEGVTFVNTDFIQFMEEILPKKFGGESTDYQLIEEEDPNGLTHLNLLISPRVGELDAKSVVETFVNLLRKAEDSPESWAQAGSAMWAQAGTIRVKRENPIPTKRAKVLPFHIVKSLDQKR
jgi:phenylacetate-coenzyme A ligase PaaK-like adenylate-forming protein